MGAAALCVCGVVRFASFVLVSLSDWCTRALFVVSFDDCAAVASVTVVTGVGAGVGEVASEVVAPAVSVAAVAAGDCEEGVDEGGSDSVLGCVRRFCCRFVADTCCRRLM